MAHEYCFQVDILEREALQVLRLVRTVKNSFAPINRIPPEILSLVPDYYPEDDMDECLIALTHVCRSWRRTFIHRPSLWTRLDLTNIGKTRTYIRRSRSSPLKLHLWDHQIVGDAFAPVTPHIGQLKSLTLTINAKAPPIVLTHFRCHAPLLEKLDIDTFATNRVLGSGLFNGDLSSLRELRVCGVITHLPWKNLANLRSVILENCFPQHSVTPLLDFFESAPLLHTVRLEGLITCSSDTPRCRMIPLRHLKALVIDADLSPSILLRHLHIPTGASLTSEFWFDGEESPYLDYLPERPSNFCNLSDITAINLLLYSRQVRLRLSGSSGSLRVLAFSHQSLPYPTRCRILRSLDPFLSTTQRLAISDYEYPEQCEVEDCPIFQVLSSANNLRTLILTSCVGLPFLRALDPGQHPSNHVLCPKLEELVFYLHFRTPVDFEHLTGMIENRSSRGSKFSSITLVSDTDLYGQVEEVLKLREHVTDVVYRVDESDPPDWDHVPGG